LDGAQNIQANQQTDNNHPYNLTPAEIRKNIWILQKTGESQAV
jgi:hypothetical protein